MSLDRTKVLETAQKYLAKSQYDKAIAEYRKLVQDDPKDVRTWLKIGDLYTRKGSQREACDTYNRVAKQYADQGFFLKAVAVYKQILKLDPTRLDVTESLGEMYEQLQLTSDALATYEMVANAYGKAGNVDKTLGTLDRMATLDPENIPVRIKYAEALSRAGKTEAAAQAFEEGSDLLKEQGRIDDYMKVAERLLFHRPNDVDVARELAQLYLERDDAKRALGKLQVCFKADPRNVDTLELLARAFKMLGQTPKTISVYREIAKIHQEGNRPEERARALATILELDPGDAEARQALAAFAPPQRRSDSVARRAPTEGSQVKRPPEAPAKAPEPKAPPVEAKAAPKAPPPAEAKPKAPPPPEAKAAAPGPARPAPPPARPKPPAPPIPRIAKPAPRAPVAPPVAARDKEPDLAPPPLELEDSSPSVPAPEPRRAISEPPDVHTATDHDAGALREALDEAIPEPPRSATMRTPADEIEAELEARDHRRAERDDVVRILDEDDDDAVALEDNEGDEADDPALEVADGDDDVVIVDGDGNIEPPPEEHRTGESTSIPPDVAREAQIARLLTECDVFIRYGLKTKVVDQLSHVLEIEPNHVEARERLRDVYLELGRTTEASNELVSLARIFMDASPSFALAHLTRAIEIDPSNEEARLDLETLAARGMSGAMRLTEPTVPEGRPPSAMISMRSSAVPIASEPAAETAPPPAGPSTSPAIAIPPPAGMPADLLSPDLEPMSPEEFDAVPLRHEQPDHTPTAVTRASMRPGEVEEILEEAEFFVAQGLFEEARATLGEALQSHPNNPLLREMLLEIEQGAAQASHSTSFIPSAPPPDESFRLAEKLAEELGPQTADSPTPGADVLDVEAVFAQFKKGVEEQVALEDSDTHFDLGIAYKEMGLIDDAIHEFTLSMSNPARECIAHTMVGLCFIEKGEVADAISHFKKGLYVETKTDREEVGLYFELGAAYELLHDPKEALYYYQKVQKRDAGFRQVGDRIRNLMSPAKPAAAGGAAPAIAKDDVDRAFDDLLSDD